MTSPEKKNRRPMKLTIADVQQIVSALKLAAEKDANDATDARAGLAGTSTSAQRMAQLLDASAQRTRELADAINTCSGLRFAPPAAPASEVG